MTNCTPDNLDGCIARPELNDFVLGKIDAQRLELVAQHVDECSACQETVIAMSQKSDTFVQAIEVAKKPASSAFEDENALALGIRRIVSAAKLGGGTNAGSKLEPLTEAFAKQQIGPYRLESRLGIGGMGAVFKATHQKLKRTVALKLLPQDRWASADLIARFEREMEAIGTLDHPNIVRASDAGEDDGLHFLVMEFVDGIDLSRMVRRLGRIPVSDACELVRQAAVGLQYAHERGLIHRDVKPSNLMLGWQQSNGTAAPKSPTVKILDMGLALLGDEHFQDEHELTTVGQMMGTLDYMSPEQGLDSHDVDARSDIFSLGATLFKLLTGTAPLDYLELKTPLKKITTLATKHLPSIRETRDDLPDELVDLVDRMLSREANERPESAREVADQLSELARNSNLSTLLNRALIADEHCESESSAIRSRGALSMALDQIPAEPIGKPTKNGIGRNLLVAAGLAAAAGILAAIFYLSTDYGHLIVESEVDDVTIEVRQGDITKKTIELANGDDQNSAKIRSGQYELVLTNAGDEFRLDKNVVTVSRNGRPTVKVTRVVSTKAHNQVAGGGWNPTTSRAILDQELSDLESSLMDLSSRYGADHPQVREATKRISELEALFAESSQSESSHSEPTYDGRAYNDWLAALKTERKAERMLDAVNALNRLASEDQLVETAKATLQTMRIYGSLSADGSAQGKLIQRVANLLYQTEGSSLIAALEEEIKNGNRRSRSFLPWVIASGRQIGQQDGLMTHQRIIKKHSERLANALDTLMHGDQRLWAVEQLITLSQLDRTLCERRPDLLEPLVDAAASRAFKSEVHGPKAALVEVLARHAKSDDVPKVVDYASALLRDRWPNNRLAAVRALGEMGASAVPAVPAMIDLLALEVDVNVAYVSNTDGFGGMGGGFGGMGGGFGSMGGGGMGGVIERDGMQFYPVTPDLRIEIVKALGAIGPEAADELARRMTPDLLTASPARAKPLRDLAEFPMSLEEIAQDAIQLIGDREKVLRNPTQAMTDARDELVRLIEKGFTSQSGLVDGIASLDALFEGQLKRLDSNDYLQAKLKVAKSNLYRIKRSYTENRTSAFESLYWEAIEQTLAKSKIAPQAYVDAVALTQVPDSLLGMRRPSPKPSNPPRAPKPKSEKDTKQSIAKYSGKTFQQWMATLEDERDPSQLRPAIQALTTLSEDGDAQVVAETFFKLMRRYRTKVYVADVDGNIDPRYYLTSAIDRAIWQLPVNAIADAFVKELESPNARSREFIAWLISPMVDAQSEFHLVKAEFRAALRDREEVIVKQLIGNAKGQKIPSLRQYYIDRLVDLRRIVGFQPEKNEEFLPLLQANLQSERFDLLALGTLVELAPETDGLARRVLNDCADASTGNQSPEVLLQALGKHAKAEVHPAVERIKNSSSASSIYWRWLGLLGADGKDVLPDLKGLIESNSGAEEPLDWWQAVVDSIENDGPPLGSKKDRERAFRDLMQSRRNVPANGMGGGGMGGGMF